MKYLVCALPMLICNEILSLLCLCAMLVCLFMDIAKHLPSNL
jgi:hypothetical protein